MKLKKNDSKKKVLFFIEDGSFTFDNRVIRETAALINVGWDITVISPKNIDDPWFKRMHPNLRAYYYPKPNAKSSMGHIIEHGITLFFGSLLSAWVFIRHGFFVFHACNPMDLLWIIALPYKLAGRKFVFDQHDLCPELFLSRGEGAEGSLFYKVLKILEKCSYGLADAVIVTNESYKEVAIQRGGKKAGEVFVVRNGPDLNKFKKSAAQKDSEKNKEILVGYLGNMNPQDGVDYLLESAEKIIRTHKRLGVKFILVGGGSHQRALRDRSAQMGLSDRVTFTGRVSDAEMLSILNACDICVQPDPFNPLNDKSTMNKAMEYMAIEKPVVAFDLKETRISCGDAALYAIPNDAAEFAEKILRLADNPSLRSHMGKIGRERIEKKLSWDYSVPHLLAAYDHVLI